MIDESIFYGYLAILLLRRDRLSLACFCAFALCLALTSPWVVVDNPTVDYLLYFSIYSTLCYYLIKCEKHLMSAMGAAAMASYDLVFALDCYINEEITYIWRNHEAFVIVLHVLLMCLYSKKCNTILGRGWYNLCMLFNTYVSNRTHSQGYGRQSGEEGYR